MPGCSKKEKHMNSKKAQLLVFILVALVQLYVPATTIWDKEEVLNTGTAYKFKTVPVDPNDPFRGKYITLYYDQNTVKVENAEDWTRGEPVYVLLTVDREGFAEIQAVSKEKPTGHQDYFRAKISYVSGDGTNKLTVAYPFNRFYMEESKAYEAEQTYIQTQRNTSKITYALVSVKNGDAVLKDVLIDGISIREIVNTNRRK